MYPLHISAALAAPESPVNWASTQLTLVFAVTRHDGSPFTGLHQSHLSIALEGSSGVYASQLKLSGEEQAVDSSGSPLFDSIGDPVMVAVPGPVPTATIPGTYRQTVNFASKSILGLIAAAIAIGAPNDSGRAVTNCHIWT